jgi:hypothetical protein
MEYNRRSKKGGWFNHSREHAIAAKGRKVYPNRRAHYNRAATKYLPQTVVEPSGQRHKLGKPKYYSLGKGRGFMGQLVLNRKHETEQGDIELLTQFRSGKKTVIYSTLFDSTGGESAYKVVDTDALKKDPSLANSNSPGWKPVKEHKRLEEAQAYHNAFIAAPGKEVNGEFQFSKGQTPWEKEAEKEERVIERKPEGYPTFGKRARNPDKVPFKVLVQEITEKPANFGKQGTLWYKGNPVRGPPPTEAQVEVAEKLGITNIKNYSEYDARRIISLAGKNYRTPITSPWSDDVLDWYKVKRVKTPQSQQEAVKGKLSKTTKKEVHVNADVKKGDIIPEKIAPTVVFTNGYPDYTVTTGAFAEEKKRRKTKKSDYNTKFKKGPNKSNVEVQKNLPSQKTPLPDEKKPLPSIVEMRRIAALEKLKQTVERDTEKRKKGWS